MDHSSCLNLLNNARAPRASGRQVELLSSLVSWPSFLPNTLCLLCFCYSVSCLFPAALSKGETVNQSRMEGCHTEHPSPSGPAATRPSGPSLLRMSQGCPETNSKPTCLFQNTQQQMLHCRLPASPPCHRLSPLPKNNLYNDTGVPRGKTPPGQIKLWEYGYFNSYLT